MQLEQNHDSVKNLRMKCKKQQQIIIVEKWVEIMATKREMLELLFTNLFICSDLKQNFFNKKITILKSNLSYFIGNCNNNKI